MKLMALMIVALSLISTTWAQSQHIIRLSQSGCDLTEGQEPSPHIPMKGLGVTART